MTDPLILRLQNRLTEHYYPCVEDGLWGAETARMLGAWQVEHGYRKNTDPLPTGPGNPDDVGSSPVYLRGVDVSRWNTPLNWVKVKQSGISFVYVKASGCEGVLYRDKAFREHVTSAQAAGLKVGAYHFHGYHDSGADQAAYFLAACSGVTLDLPPALDVEDRTTPIKGAACLTAIKGCLTEVERLFARRPVLYTSAGVLAAHSCDTKDAGLERYSLWVARYGVKDPAKGVPACYQGAWAIWQPCFDDDLPGASGDVDRDLCRVSLSGL